MSMCSRWQSTRFRLLALGLILLHSCAALGRQNPIAEQSTVQEARFKIAGTIVNALDGAPLGQARVSIFDDYF